MKTMIQNIRFFLLPVILLVMNTINAQIVLNTTPTTGTCNLGSYGAVTISAPTEALTGDNIALNITLPGTLPAGCNKEVTITRSSNLLFQSSGGVAFGPVGGDPQSHENTDMLPGNDGQNFNVFFKFPNYTTCNGAVGTFDVTVTADCGGTIVTCTTSISVIARADNYWSISKDFITGDLTCGVSKWKINLTHNNPNGAGLGTYNILGTITETPTVPIVSGASFSISQSGYTNGTWPKYVTLQNCSPTGSTITNTATYNFTFGDGTCDAMSGTISETSPPLASPNASISFSKTVSSPYYTNLTPGCDARYRISICNNGNVPWTDLQIQDNLNIPGITITGMSLGAWTATPSVPPYSNTNYTFDAPPGFILNPGECQNIYVYFTIDSGATIGSTITNTATLSYVASGVGGSSSGGSGSSPCPTIACPTLDTSIQNTSDDVSFVVEAPKAIPSIKKCIVDPPNTLVPPIYQIGDVIKYSVMIGNSGSAPLSDIINDAMGMPGQNLEILPGSITYSYHANQNTGYKYSCSPPFGAGVPPPFSVVADTSDLQNPFWTITNMPGICDYYKSNFLVIEFEAEILPQLSGTKTNTATIPYGTSTLSSSVNYSIDQVGILGIHKEADEEIVENGGSFNYLITVSNNGSVPLDNVVVTDILPDCVNISGPIEVKDDFGGTVTSSSSGSVVININPSTQLMPGENFNISIPITKSGSGSCCNESVSVTADMTTSGIELNANYGSPEAPAACVTGTECCDIEDFEATLSEQNGSFNVNITGGALPLQEVEISMVDYHIEYSEEDCKPDDLGIFGTLTTSTTALSSLILNATDNGTHGLTWGLGDPAIINSNVALDILYPELLNLDCCEVDFYFCLKVRVMDVDCNVCEKIICFSSDDLQHNEPCTLEISDFPQGQKYCVGDTINLNWTGTSPSGNVDISLFDNTTNSVYQVLATSIPNTGSYTYTIPPSIPCDPPRSWSLIIEDPQDDCFARSLPFIIECCEQTACNCGEWQSSKVGIKWYLNQSPYHPDLKTFFNQYFQKTIDCGDEIQLKPFNNYTFTAPTYICNPEDCEVEYKYEVVLPNSVIVHGNGKNFNYNFSMNGMHQINFIPICGNERCPPCTIYVYIKKPGHDNPNEHTEKFQIRQEFGPVQGNQKRKVNVEKFQTREDFGPVQQKHDGTNENDWELINGKNQQRKE